ncbi:MAG: DUF305 domain-containing protein [Actinobacteria bacterium]|nr:DUF305 domain-containing protein [Actinomycetota bacterium]
MKKNHSLIAIALVVVLVACGSNSSDTTGGSDTTTASESTMNSFNDADVMFAQMMIPHHEQAIEMSDIALDPTVGASQQILDLATQIKAAQDPEITQMKNLLTAWNMPIAAESGMDHSSMMSGMMSSDEMAELGKKMGKDFDVAWAEAMIAHHEGAIEMANTVLDDGTNAEIRELAQVIVKGQQAEIETLQSIVAEAK